MRSRQVYNPCMRSRALGTLALLILATAEIYAFQTAPVAPPGCELTLLDTSLNLPVALAFAPDGRLFIGQQGGVIRVFKDGAMNADPYATVTPIYTSTEAGLVGLCLDPDFEANGYLYVFVTRAQGVQQILRYTTNGDTGSDLTVVVDNIPHIGAIHNGGGIGFGPDGYLYAVVGDNNSPSDAQVSASWRGKVLRFDASTAPATIPSTNPTAGSAVYSLGHRNPFRLAFRPGSGALYVSENGPSDYDEINVITPGANYGWPTYSGPAGSRGYVQPIHAIGPTTAITDLHFYTGPTLPFAGQLLYAEYNMGRIRRLELSASGEAVTGVPFDVVTGVTWPIDLAQGPDGALYFCGYGGALFKLQTAAPLTVAQVDPAPGSESTTAPAAVTLTFSRPVKAGAGSAITLTRAGVDGLFDTADDVTVAPVAVSINGETVTLDLTGLALPVDEYRVAISGSAAAAPSALPGLWAHWSMDDGAGNIVADSSGNGRDGMLTDIEWSPGLFGSALRFSGDHGFVDIDAGVLPPEWAAAMWVRRSEIGTWWWTQTLIDTKEPDTNTSLRLRQSAGDDVGITEYGVIDYGSGYEAPLEEWIHLAFTSDASNARFYVNGVLENTAPRPFDLSVDMLGSAIVPRTYSLAGFLDEVQIYDRALTDAEIASLAVAPSGLRSVADQLLDGEFSGTLPSGDGVEGGDFVSTFRIIASPPPPPPPPPPAPVDPVPVRGEWGCGLLGIEPLLILALILLIQRRRRRIAMSARAV